MHMLPLPHTQHTGRKRFDTTTLNRKSIKRAVVDLYAATTTAMAAEFRTAKDAGRALVLMIDIWDDKVSKRKWLGASVFCVLWVD